ncbi:UNVERIFIED_CONTAM: hypothetical protein GTU68_036780 [Idotea baltica]|nr:hypothetical protein [Idotea baltica]
MLLWLIIPISYLLGSISFALLLSRWANLGDPREFGSKNPGTTNMLRTANKQLAALTLIGDISKGTIPIIVAQHYGASTYFQAWVALASGVGHIYPIFFSFQGGKGMATTLGSLLMLSVPTGVITTIIWLVVFVCSRISSVATFSSLAIALLLCTFLIPRALLPVTILILLVLWRHRSNAYNLIVGQEHHFK